MKSRSTNQSKRILFTVDSLDGIPTDRPVEISDAATPALKLRVSDRGTKSLSMVYRSPVDQVRRRLTFGRYESQMRSDRNRILQDARNRYAQARLILQAKRDPIIEANLDREKQRGDHERLIQRKVHAERTIESVAREFLNSRDCPDATRDQTRRALDWHWFRNEKSVRSIGSRPISELRAPDIMMRIDQLRAEGKDGAAREAKKHISRVFAFAVRRGYVTGNPASAIQLRGLRKSRARALSEDQLGAAWAATSVLSEPWRQTFRIFILTALRRNELLDARWLELSRCGNWLDIPADRMKMDRPLRVALCRSVQSEIASLRSARKPDMPIITCDPEEVRPARGIYKQRDVWCKEIARLLGVNEIRFRIHDLRHTAKTHLTKLGTSDSVSEAILGHQKQGMRAIYDHYRYETECREALELYAEHVLKLASQLNG